MTTLRESLQAEIATAKADVAAKEAQLAQFESAFSDTLARDVDELKVFFRSVGAHLLGHPAAAMAADTKPAA